MYFPPLSFLILIHTSSPLLEVWQSASQWQLLPLPIHDLGLTVHLAVNQCCFTDPAVRATRRHFSSSDPMKPVGSRSASRQEVFSESSAGGWRTSTIAGLVAPLGSTCKFLVLPLF